MKEAISKYTALEVLHTVGPRGRRRREATEPGETPEPGCWRLCPAVLAGKGFGGAASSGALEAVCSWMLRGTKPPSPTPGWGMGCVGLGEVCTLES